MTHKSPITLSKKTKEKKARRSLQNNVEKEFIQKVGGCGMDTSGSGWESVAVSSEQVNEPSKAGNFLSS
jgi:hypothetical protein